MIALNSRRRRRVPVHRFAFGALLVALARLPAQTPQRQITGIVSEQGSSARLTSASIQVRGALGSTLSGENGAFSLRVPEGDVVLLVRHIGYSPAELRVAAGETSVAVSLARDALMLDEVVVTGQATGASRRSVATSIAIVSGEELTTVPAQSVDLMLQGKVAGAQITQRTGQPGGGSLIRIRGVSSVFGGSVTPMYVLDGVIVSDIANPNGQTRVTNGAGVENPINRITDLDPNDIQNIEVLKGSAAAAIYGSKAAAGVIMITTKRGTVGRPRYHLTVATGTSSLAYRNGQRAWTKDLAVAAFGNAAATYFDANGAPKTVLDYESLVLDAKPRNADVSFSVSGGSVDARYFVSALMRNEGGIALHTGARKLGLRGNADMRLTDRAQLQLGTSIMHTVADRGLFGNDNNFSSIGGEVPKIPSFMDLRQDSTGAWPRNPFAFSNPLQTLALAKNQEDTWRSALSGRLQWSLIESRRHDVRFVGYGGLDVYRQDDDVYSPPELYYEVRKANPGSRAYTASNDVLANLNINLVHTWRPSERVTANTQIGSQFERFTEAWVQSFAANLTSGVPILDAGIASLRTTNEFRILTEDFGLFAQTEWSILDRLFLTAGARADRSTNNAAYEHFYFFPKASVSYRWNDVALSSLHLFDDLKWRFAYGETGNRPTYGSKFTTLVQGSIGGAVAYVPSSARAGPDLRPERQREMETGFDASLFGRRAGIDVTLFRRETSDLLLNRSPAPSIGYTSELSNIGRLRTWGVEAALSTSPINSASHAWTSRVNFGMNRSKVISIPGDSAVIFGSSLTQGQVWLRPGHSATEIMGNDTLPKSPREVVPVVIGDGAPQFTASWANQFRWRRLSGSLLFDHQRGGLLWSGTWALYDANRNSRDYDEFTPWGAKWGEARFTARNFVTRTYMQDVTNTKLREITLGWDLPSRFGTRSARIQFSGRNLHSWTKFRGGDPEADNFPGGFGTALQRNRELAAYPPSRSFWLTLNLEM